MYPNYTGGTRGTTGTQPPVDPNFPDGVKLRFEEGSVRGRIPQKLRKRVFDALLNKVNPNQKETIRWLSRKHWLYLWLLGIWPYILPAVLTLGAIAVAAVFGSTVNFHLPTLGGGLPTLNNTTHPSTTVHSLLPKISSLPIHSTGTHVHFPIPWILIVLALLVLWLLAVGLSWLMTIRWRYFFYVWTDQRFVLLILKPPFFFWRNTAPEPLSLEFCQGVVVEEGPGFYNTFRIGLITVESNLSDKEAEKFKKLPWVRDFQNFAKVGDACRIAARQKIRY